VTVRDDRAAALIRRHRDLSDDFTRALPGLLDDLEAIDAAHDGMRPGGLAETVANMTEAQWADLKARVPVGDDTPPPATADPKAAPGTPEFDERTAAIRAAGFGFEADARDKLAAETRVALAKPAPRRRTTR
jgi:hypothetical protein